MPANQPYDLAFWRGEVDRATRIGEQQHPRWQENLNYYVGTPLGTEPTSDYVNVNVDFYQVEQKGAQLFFETPELQMTPGVGFDPSAQGVVAFRALLNALLGPDQIDALTTVLKAIKDCTATSGVGATVIGYQPTIQPVDQTPVPGAILGLSQSVPVPIFEAWFWDRFSSKKFLIPSDFTDTDFDKAPWLGMRFRMPLKAARTICEIPPDFEGTTTRDERVLTSGPTNDEATALAYVDGVLVWYKASLFDDDEIHPQIYRRHILIDGLEAFADKDDPLWRSPYQTKLPNGRLRADSLIGNPIHPLTLRDVPDSAYVPCDSQMTRPLVKELCLFRTQMVQERDANKLKFGYNAQTIPPDAVVKITDAMTGSLIPLPAEAFAGGLDNNFREFGKAQQSRQSYVAGDIIKRDIQETLALDSTGVGVDDNTEETATKTAAVERSRNVRLDAERKRVLRWYLKGVDKIASLALRYCTDPLRVAELIGPGAAQAYLQWRATVLEQGDLRPKFTAKADSQIKLDAAQERKTWLTLYNFAAKDPQVNRVAILKKLFALYGEDPQAYVTDQPPDSKPEPSLGYSFKGEDLNPLAPQFPIILEVLAQCGVQISKEAIAEAQQGALTQTLTGILQPTAAGSKPASKKPAEHGGLTDKMGPLSKQDSEQTGQRPGPAVQ